MHDLKVINRQPAEGPVKFSGTYDVQEVFPTIQGEGPDAGVPAVFVRLAGCTLTCPACDSDYTSKRTSKTVVDLLKEVVDARAQSKADLLVITGGEPFRQDLTALVQMAETLDMRVSVETNGTIDIGLSVNLPWWRMLLVCSPKTGTVHESIRKANPFWKYIIEAGKVDENDGLPTSSLGMANPPARPWKDHSAVAHLRKRVFVQPLDDQDPIKNRVHSLACVKSAMKFGYRVSVQTHKILGLP